MCVFRHLACSGAAISSDRTLEGAASMSLASDYVQTASVSSAPAGKFDPSLMAVFVVATIGMLVSTLATIVNPQWFVG